MPTEPDKNTQSLAVLCTVFIMTAMEEYLQCHKDDGLPTHSVTMSCSGNLREAP